MTNTQAKRILREKGYSWERGAKALGYSFTHLAHMLTGRRPVSLPAQERIRALPKSPVPFCNRGFALSRNRKHSTKK